MGSCAGSGQNKQKHSRDERIRTEPDKGRGSDAFTGGVNVSNASGKSAELKWLDLPNQKKKTMKKQESLKVTLSITNGPISKYYIRKNLRYLEGVNFKDNMFVVQHIVTGKIRVAERFSMNTVTNAFINKIIYLQLNHPNLLDIYGIFLENNYYTIITDYCNGGSLLSLLSERNTHFEEGIAAQCCRQIYELMSYLHKYGLYHGSLSLRSFEKYNQGKKHFKLKLVDFSSLFCKSDINESNVQFLSPECCSEKQSYTAARDQWAVGIITMAIAFGKLPFDANSLQECLENIQSSCKKEGFLQKELEKQIGNPLIKDLVLQFLQIVPSKRIDFIQALDSKWMKNYEQVSKQQFKQCLDELTKKEANFLQSCFLLMMIKQFDDQYSQIQEIFNGLDIDKNGRLTKPELVKHYTQYFNAQYKPHEIHDFVNEIFTASDINNSGDIELSEFLIALSNPKTIITNENLKCIFNQINQGQPFGFNELQPLFRTKEAEIQSSLQQIPNQIINFEEFQKLMFELIEDK
ncbi:unnamed protein product (macronuclear) [Paramecium tetraurelia]|uniref:Protein kinase domain-containing protein n=1 Tax=Paramecium tetraurelia TaxID=5888 RepID=A0C417_PARTE|nr:uncharacterized protein GSPATT00035014001 [Paramecium tetraurelia]CAK65534.1 unnamed protein product [Paramecium tetraurelia]|eukprot:XP_001432931.1 hypothetical protein (macronuclear) [Paramecium tetraurelia strain d4-2]